MLDLDELAAAEGVNWVWGGATLLRPGKDRALVKLSRGGADPAVVREFDLDTLQFAPGGFELPEAKTQLAWIDQDQIFVATDFGPGSLTSSGYPRIVKRWRRGTPVDAATVVFEGDPSDMMVFGWHDPTPGHQISGVTRQMSFFTSEEFVSVDGALVKLDVPDDAVADVHGGWLLVRTRTPWTVGGASFPAGALLAARMAEFLDGRRELSMLFEPDQHSTLHSYSWTQHHLIMHTLVDVRSRLEVLTPTDGEWQRRELPGIPPDLWTEVTGADPDTGDEYLLTTSGFTEPPTLRRGNLAELSVQVEALKAQPASFDAHGLAVEQLFATSADGTRVPYFVVRPEDGAPSRPAPTLLTGYGGFEISRTPAYSGLIGRGWLVRGGVFVQACIRGGGECGAAWHEAALKQHRHRAFEDFAAVATDLIERGITTPAQLGIRGLLTGVMLTRHPELFGAVVSPVPLLDMLRYHQLLAGASWIAEYGDPAVEAEREYLAGYSPYHNLDPDRAYPPTLLMTSTRDDRVHPGHARKIAARMREYGLDVRYYETTEGGHGAAATNQQRAHMNALMFEFLWQHLAQDTEQ